MSMFGRREPDFAQKLGQKLDELANESHPRLRLPGTFDESQRAAEFEDKLRARGLLEHYEKAATTAENHAAERVNLADKAKEEGIRLVEEYYDREISLAERIKSVAANMRKQANAVFVYLEGRKAHIERVEETLKQIKEGHADE